MWMLRKLIVVADRGTAAVATVATVVATAG